MYFNSLSFSNKPFKFSSLFLIAGSLLIGCNTSKSGISQVPVTDSSEVIKFDFGSGEVAPGYIQILPTTKYTEDRGYGLVSKGELTAVNRKGKDLVKSDFITSSEPFYFSVDLPEGNYEVTLTLGDLESESVTTVKAESRRLMLEKVETPAGKVEKHTFTVNVRTPKINEQGAGNKKKGGKFKRFVAKT